MGGSAPNDVVAQKWDDQKQRLVRTTLRAPEAEIDVKYDALLANRRTLDDPEIISVNAGESVLLRLVAASSNQNFYVDTGGLEAELLAVDGKAVQPIKGNFFQLGVAQRLDLKVIIPKDGGALSDPRARRRDETALRSRAGHKRSICSEALPNSLCFDCGARQHSGKEASGCQSPSQSCDRSHPACIAWRKHGDLCLDN